MIEIFLDKIRQAENLPEIPDIKVSLPIIPLSPKELLNVFSDEEFNNIINALKIEQKISSLPNKRFVSIENIPATSGNTGYF